MDTDLLTLRIISPEGIIAEASCDSIILPVRDNKAGKGGGQYGIRKGHTDALFATEAGVVTGKKDGEIIFSESLSEGFARVSRNSVTISAKKA